MHVLFVRQLGRCALDVSARVGKHEVVSDDISGFCTFPSLKLQLLPSARVVNLSKIFVLIPISKCVCGEGRGDRRADME